MRDKRALTITAQDGEARAGIHKRTWSAARHELEDADLVHSAAGPAGSE